MVEGTSLLTTQGVKALEGSNPSDSANLELKSLASPLRGLASRDYYKKVNLLELTDKYNFISSSLCRIYI